MEVLNLSVGGGTGPELPGYEIVDRKNGDEAFPLTLHGQPVADNSVDRLYCSHVLEHFGHRETLDVLKEWVRVLKPGGILQVAVPDFHWCHVAYAQGRKDVPVEAYLYGGQTDENDFHKSAFTEESLRVLLHAAGLECVRKWKSTIQDCASLEVSLNLQGRKPDPDLNLDGVRAVLSLPRFAPTDAFDAAQRALAQCNVPLRFGKGVYWDKALSLTIQKDLDEGASAILTLDYDTIFLAEHVRELYRLLMAHPEADAICAMQMRRGGEDGALLVIMDDNGLAKRHVRVEDMQEEVVPVDSAHFGLTIFRAGSLRSLKKPWFEWTHDKEGSYGEGSVDPDVNFWLNFKKQGKKLFVAPHVAVGHLCEVILWPDRNFQVCTQGVNDWRVEQIPLPALR